MAFPEESTARFKRQRSELAINLAMQNRWEDAVTANQSILSIFPNDVDALNRLGKAYTELGKYGVARQAYGKALETEPSNTIAKKNLVRLAGLKEASTESVAATRVDPSLFIEEAGKTSVVALQNLAPREVLAKVTAGDQVQLGEDGKQLAVYTLGSDYVGQVEPRLGSRLLKLMGGGNRYEAAITSVTDQHVRVILREVYQSPDLMGRPSFPSRAETGVRPYIKESILQYGDDDEYVEEEEGEAGEWTDSSEETGGFIATSLSAEEHEDDEEEEE